MKYSLATLIFFAAMIPMRAFCLEREDHAAPLNRMITNQSQPAIDKQFLLINPSSKASAESKPMKKSSNHSKAHHKENENKFHHDHRYSHDRQQIEAVLLPSGFKSVATEEGIFYYNNGVFYQLINYNLFPVDAPLGAVIDDLPTSRVSKTIEGDTYYIYKNIYYIMTPEGHFQVVDPPFLELNELEEMIDPDSL